MTHKNPLSFLSLSCLLALGATPAVAELVDWHRALAPGVWIGGVVSDATGNSYAVGGFSGTVDMDPGPGVLMMSAQQDDAYVSKYNPAGELLWCRIITGPYDGGAGHVLLRPSGEVMIAGTFRMNADFDPGPAEHMAYADDWDCDADAFILTLDASGNFVSVHTFGGPHADGIRKLQLDAEGNIYAMGSFVGSIDMDPGPGLDMLVAQDQWRDGFVLKLDPNGAELWARQVVTSSASTPNDYAVTAAGEVYLLGNAMDTTDLDPGPGEVLADQWNALTYLAKWNTDGEFLWSRFIQASMAGYLELDPQENIIVSGSYGYFPVDFDPGPAEDIHTTLADEQEGYVWKLTPDGEHLWVSTMVTPEYSRPVVMAVDDQGNIITVGEFLTSVDLDPGLGTHLITYIPGSGTEYFSVLDPQGAFVAAGSFPGAFIYNISTTPTGELRLSGGTYSTMDLDPGEGETLFTPPSGINGKVYFQLGHAFTDLPELAADDVDVYPVPATDFLTIANVDPGMRTTLRDMRGAVVLDETVQGTSERLDIRSLAAGTYLLDLFDAGSRSTRLVVKQ